MVLINSLVIKNKIIVCYNMQLNKIVRRHMRSSGEKGGKAVTKAVQHASTANPSQTTGTQTTGTQIKGTQTTGTTPIANTPFVNKPNVNSSHNPIDKTKSLETINNENKNAHLRSVVIQNQECHTLNNLLQKIIKEKNQDDITIFIQAYSIYNLNYPKVLKEEERLLQGLKDIFDTLEKSKIRKISREERENKHLSNIGRNLTVSDVQILEVLKSIDAPFRGCVSKDNLEKNKVIYEKYILLVNDILAGKYGDQSHISASILLELGIRARIVEYKDVFISYENGKSKKIPESGETKSLFSKITSLWDKLTFKKTTLASQNVFLEEIFNQIQTSKDNIFVGMVSLPISSNTDTLLLSPQYRHLVVCAEVPGNPNELVILGYLTTQQKNAPENIKLSGIQPLNRENINKAQMFNPATTLYKIQKETLKRNNEAEEYIKNFNETNDESTSVYARMLVGIKAAELHYIQKPLEVLPEITIQVLLEKTIVGFQRLKKLTDDNLVGIEKYLKKVNFESTKIKYIASLIERDNRYLFEQNLPEEYQDLYILYQKVEKRYHSEIDSIGAYSKVENNKNEH